MCPDAQAKLRCRGEWKKTGSESTLHASKSQICARCMLVRGRVHSALMLIRELLTDKFKIFYDSFNHNGLYFSVFVLSKNLLLGVVLTADPCVLVLFPTQKLPTRNSQHKTNANPLPHATFPKLSNMIFTTQRVWN